MTIVIVLSVTIGALVFAGCKLLCPQSPDKRGMEYKEDSVTHLKTVNQIEVEDGHNKEAILDGPDGTSTHAFKGSTPDKESINDSILIKEQ